MKCANRGLFVCLFVSRREAKGKKMEQQDTFDSSIFSLCFAVGDNHKVWIGKKKAIWFCCLYPYLSWNDERTGRLLLNMALCTSWLRLSIWTPYFVKWLTSHSLVSLKIYSVNPESTQIPANNLATKDIQPNVKDGLVVLPLCPQTEGQTVTYTHIHTYR